jgi:hypothetical protein
VLVRIYLVEGVVIAAQVKLAKTLGLPPQWVAALRSYGEAHALATAVPPIFQLTLHILQFDSMILRSYPLSGGGTPFG